MIFFLLESDSNATPRVSENCQLHYDYGSDPKTNENSISGGGGYEISTVPNENRKKRAVFILAIRMEAAFCFNLIVFGSGENNHFGSGENNQF